MNRAACTIVSNNYLAFARVVARSFAKHHPDIPFYTLIVDRPSLEVDYQDQPFTSLFIDDLPFRDAKALCFRYSILELNTAVKPTLIKYLLSEAGAGASQVLYFDPDILITNPLEPAWSALQDASVVLTPHVVEPLPDDNLGPNERSFLQSGIYNLGFVGFSKTDETATFLDWWEARLAHRCLAAVDEWLFVDQKWMDLAPAYLDRVKILRDPGFNVAYWNLSNRSVEATEDGWTASGHPLRFFHFSGIEIDDLDALSKHQNRHKLSDFPGLTEFFTEYVERLMAEGHDQLRALPYGLGSFDNGDPIPDFARVSYRNQKSCEARWPNPFGAGEGSFREWLEEIVDEEVGFPRFAEEIRAGRIDLITAFPEIPGTSEVAYAQWLLEQGPAPNLLLDHWLPLLERYQNLTSIRHRPAEFQLLSCPDSSTRLPTEKSDPTQVGDPLLDFLRLLHLARRDLQDAFPDPGDKDRKAFLYWWVSEGSLEVPGAHRTLTTALSLLPTKARLSAGLRRRYREWERDRSEDK